jgi:TonB family protein
MSRSSRLAGIGLWLAAAGPLAVAQSQEPPAPIVLACVDKKGELISAEIFQSSNIPEIDEAALKIARAAKFSPASNSLGQKKRKSCLKFKVKFVIRDGEVVPETA